MKDNLAVIVLWVLMFAALLGLCVFATDRQTELNEAQRIVDTKQTECIKELQKEIRLLKTDIQILQYGYEEAE